jgi:hypothetical protein
MSKYYFKLIMKEYDVKVIRYPCLGGPRETQFLATPALERQDSKEFQRILSAKGGIFTSNRAREFHSKCASLVANPTCLCAGRLSPTI